MENILNNFAAAFNAVMYYIVAGISLLVSNKYFLGFSLVLLLITNKSLKISKLLNVKG